MVMYPIGAFAKLTGVTPKALYLYERRGLIAPRRSKAGYAATRCAICTRSNGCWR